MSSIPAACGTAKITCGSALVLTPGSPGHAWAGCPAPLAGALYTWRICASLSADDNRANERWNSEVAT
jgi:hypothetical protein